MLETATFANGCFWCTEAIFKRLKGVASVKSGYTGGNINNPSYEQVSTGTTNHAEAIQIKFNPDLISYDILLKIFFATHDPTTLNRQGADTGTQYRSEIFYHNDTQLKAAQKAIQSLEKNGIYKKPIVTKISKLKDFYEAENYHKDYYDNNQLNPYCQIVINPKVRKLIEQFTDYVEKEYK